MFGVDHPSVAYHHPYRRRTFWRILLPRPFCWWIGKGWDCEKVGAEHHWYSIDDRESACYHCKVVQEGRLWETHG